MGEAKGDTKRKSSLEKITRLVEVAKDLQAKQNAILEEIDNILGGKASIGEKMRALTDGFGLAWASRYAPGAGVEAYAWKKDRDFKMVKVLAKKFETDELLERAARYIQSEDPFFVRSRHEFQFFSSTINRWIAPADAPENLALDSAPTDCKHKPRCKDDAEHTKRRQRELRASA